jgi:outer membrane protein OmpA-like peptidoglycan-associated protein
VKKNNLFWIGYSDLMTSLFFVMLVIAVITIGSLKKEKEVKEAQLNKINELQTAVQQLPAEYFSYDSLYKRFKLKEQIQFDVGSSLIKAADTDYLLKVGKSINDLITRLNENPGYKKFDIKYLIVIEGMASNDRWPDNFKLSYERSMSLHNLWKNNSIVFNPQICELQIAGSGTEGVGRYPKDQEYKNQQFLIHIIPKIGRITEK